MYVIKDPSGNIFYAATDLNRYARELSKYASLPVTTDFIRPVTGKEKQVHHG